MQNKKRLSANKAAYVLKLPNGDLKVIGRGFEPEFRLPMPGEIRRGSSGENFIVGGGGHCRLAKILGSDVMIVLRNPRT